MEVTPLPGGHLKWSYLGVTYIMPMIIAGTIANAESEAVRVFPELGLRSLTVTLDVPSDARSTSGTSWVVPQESERPPDLQSSAVALHHSSSGNTPRPLSIVF